MLSQTTLRRDSLKLEIQKCYFEREKKLKFSNDKYEAQVLGNSHVLGCIKYLKNEDIKCTILVNPLRHNVIHLSSINF